MIILFKRVFDDDSVPIRPEVNLAQWLLATENQQICLG